MMNKKNYTYMVKCKDDTIYTGWTVNLDRRIKEHNKGIGSKYTRSRRPVKLVYYEEFDTRSQAMKREYAIKQLSRKDKLNLISKFKK